MEDLTYSGYKMWALMYYNNEDVFTIERKDCEKYFSKNIYYRGIEELLKKGYLKKEEDKIESYLFYPFSCSSKEERDENIWTVYMLTFPDDTKYVGITSKEPAFRWGPEGRNYRNMTVYEPIEKWGWENVKHEILCSNLSEKEARIRERLYIEKYNTSIKGKGYNVM